MTQSNITLEAKHEMSQSNITLEAKHEISQSNITLEAKHEKSQSNITLEAKYEIRDVMRSPFRAKHIHDIMLIADLMTSRHYSNVTLEHMDFMLISR